MYISMAIKIIHRLPLAAGDAMAEHKKGPVQGI